MASFKTILIGVVAALIGLGTFYIGYGQYALLSQSQSWPSVQGTILSSNASQSCNSKGGCYYFADVGYTYQVNGQTYTGSSLTPVGNSEPSFSQAQQDAQQYHVGSTTNVYYNPVQPSQAALQLTSNATTPLFLVLVGAIFFLAGLVAIYIGLRRY